MIAYTVRIHVPAALEGEWRAWIDGHVREVIAAGALAAEVVRLDGADPVFEARYRFAGRDTFAAYERDHAPRLRAEGLARFGPERGVRYERSLGEVVTRA